MAAKKSGGTQTFKNAAGVHRSASKCAAVSVVRPDRETSDYYHGLLVLLGHKNH